MPGRQFLAETGEDYDARATADHGDTLAAGAFKGDDRNPAAIGQRWERPLLASEGGRDLVELGMKDDIADAVRVDAYPVLPLFHERRIQAAS